MTAMLPAAIATCLSEGMTPSEIDAAVSQELRRQAPGWCHHPDGSYRLRSGCGECRTREVVRRIDAALGRDGMQLALGTV